MAILKNGSAERLLLDTKCLHELLPKMRECAQLLETAVQSNAPIRVRFHDDCDGICSAISITLAISKLQKRFGAAENSEIGIPLVSSSQASSAIYETRDAFDDLRAMQAFAPKKPLFLLLDFAANAESVQGVRALKDAGAKVAIIDHHPPSKEAAELADCFVSSHACDKTGSHTAGLLSTQVARIVDEGVPEECAWYSLQSDKSALAKSEEFKEAVALDYLAHHSDKGVPADYYAEKLSDGQTVELSWKLALRAEQRVLEVAQKHVKLQGCDCEVKFILVELDKLAKKGEYPSKGKIMNGIIAAEAKKEKIPLVALGFTKDSISVRATDLALEKGFRASQVIAELKLEFPQGIASGGGHDAASSLRLNEGYAKPVLSRFEHLACIQFKTKNSPECRLGKAEKCNC